MHIFNLLLLSLFSLNSCSRTDQNCNDKSATNFVEGSRTDEGCTYQTQTKKPTLIAELKKEVKETSGLAYVNEMLYTHNDRGGEPILYALAPEDGRITARLTLNTENVDWEDLAQSEHYVFVGDMGNNDGDRKDLRIIKLAKSKLQSSGDHQVEHDGLITFTYPDQQVFIPNRSHNHDCEALIYADEYLYLFSKNRGDSRSNLYRIPAEEGDYTAEKIGDFPAGVRITGGDISPSGNTVVLCGYNKSDDCILWVFSGYSNNQFLEGNKSIIRLGKYSEIGQLEAVVFTSETHLYLSSEKEKDHNLKARLYELEL